tara:strand:- start:243 stop:467 length:225 start_codon:yes stop_codon:yes gene_type:complete
MALVGATGAGSALDGMCDLLHCAGSKATISRSGMSYMLSSACFAPYRHDWGSVISIACRRSGGYLSGVEIRFYS